MYVVSRGGLMKLKEIIVNNKYEKLFEKYLEKNDVFNVINELSEIEDIEIYKLLNIYKIIYLKHPTSEQYISMNLVYRHKLNNEGLFSWLLLIDDKSEKNWDNIYYKVSEDKIFCWKKIFFELINYNPKHRNVVQKFFSKIINYYNFEQIKDLEYTTDEIILVCSKLNYLIDLYPNKLLELFEDIININNFTEKEFLEFLSPFLFNYSYVVKKYIESQKIKKDTIFYKYMEEYVNNFVNEQEQKTKLLDLKGYDSRLIEYEKRRAKQQQEINEQSKKYSIFYEFSSHSTVMYGDDIAYIMSDGTISFSKFQKFESSCPIPFGYILDPIKYLSDAEFTLSKKVGDE